MGILQRLSRKMRQSSSRDDPREGLLARLPGSVVASASQNPELAQAFPSIPPEHLNVLVAFIRVAAVETGAPALEGVQLRRALEVVCRDYESGALEVKPAGSEWQVWQKGVGLAEK